LRSAKINVGFSTGTGVAAGAATVGSSPPHAAKTNANMAVRPASIASFLNFTKYITIVLP
jgi:hypothetical protein